VDIEGMLSFGLIAHLPELSLERPISAEEANFLEILYFLYILKIQNEKRNSF